MSQLAHIEATETPVDITDGLGDGRYIAMVTSKMQGRGVLYATAATAPTDLDDWFSAERGDSFVFCVGDDIDPTWVRIDQLELDSSRIVTTAVIARAFASDD